MDRVVVLPATFGPTNPYIDPRGIAKSSWLTAQVWPKNFVNERIRTIGALGVEAAGAAGVCSGVVKDGAAVISELTIADSIGEDCPTGGHDTAPPADRVQGFHPCQRTMALCVW